LGLFCTANDLELNLFSLGRRFFFELRLAPQLNLCLHVLKRDVSCEFRLFSLKAGFLKKFSLDNGSLSGSSL